MMLQQTLPSYPGYGQHSPGQGQGGQPGVPGTTPPPPVQAMTQRRAVLNRGPSISPVRGKYEWNRHEGGGVLVTFDTVPPGCHLHWRFEWIRNGK